MSEFTGTSTPLLLGRFAVFATVLLKISELEERVCVDIFITTVIAVVFDSVTRFGIEEGTKEIINSTAKK